MIVTTKEFLKQHLLSYGETELADKVDNLSNDEMNEIGRLAAKYISKERLLAKLMTLGAIEFFEGNYREPKRKKRIMSFYEQDTIPASEPEEKVSFLQRLAGLFSFKKK